MEPKSNTPKIPHVAHANILGAVRSLEWPLSDNMLSETDGYCAGETHLAGISSSFSFSSSSSIRLATGFTNFYFFDYENEDDDEDEKQSNRHFRRLPLEKDLSKK
jgi:hypothetical protein